MLLSSYPYSGPGSFIQIKKREFQLAAALRNPAGHVVLNDYSLIGRRSNKRLLPLMANFTLRALICDRLFKMRVLQVPAEQILPEEERNHRSQDKVWAERHRRAP